MVLRTNKIRISQERVKSVIPDFLDFLQRPEAITITRDTNDNFILEFSEELQISEDTVDNYSLVSVEYFVRGKWIWWWQHG